MRYGHFDDKRREYAITRPDTPLPWINYPGCESYFGIISNTAGRYIYLRDHDTGALCFLPGSPPATNWRATPVGMV